MQINDIITVDWRHNIEEKKTLCAITVNDKQTIGVSKVGHGDMYCKRVGRKLSLTRALILSGLDRAQRTLVWNVARNKGVKLV